LRDLPIGRIPGVGKVTEQQLLDAGIKTVGDVQAMDAVTLEARFGRYGLRLCELSRGIDHSPVVPNRLGKSISAEDTFPEDIPLPETESAIRRLAEKVWAASRENARGARTVMLKLKTKEFSTLTRSLTPLEMPGSADGLAAVALSLFDRVELGADPLFRLVGVGPFLNYSNKRLHCIQSVHIGLPIPLWNGLYLLEKDSLLERESFIPAISYIESIPIRNELYS
jgi:DNA polymerase-4